MDVLKPELLWIGSRCYRVNKTEGSKFENTNEDVLVETNFDCYEDENCDMDYDIEEMANGRFKTSVPIPSAYFRFLIGAKGMTRRRLEQETNTQVMIPKTGKDGDVVIRGGNRQAVASCKSRIDMLVDAARQKQPFTHFLSIPINSPPLQEAETRFKEEVLKECGECRGIDDTIFQTPAKLHLTLGTLVLLDDRERQRAAELLTECHQDIINPILKGTPLVARVEGLEYMNDDPAEVDVLYAKIEASESTESLQLLSDSVVERFVKRGLMLRQYDRVKLHLTLMNTIFRSDNVTEQENSGTKRESFNAGKLLEMFGNYSFGEQRVEAIHVSQRYSTAKNGYYLSTARVDLP